MTALWTSAEIEAATGGTASAPFEVTGVTFDSREVGPGDLFVAMPGTVHDGHSFVAKAFASGAAGALVSQPADGPAFERFVKLMRTCPRIWSKVTCPERLSVTGPPHYTDFVPFARRLVEEFPDRVLWGTDWPHPNLRTHMPDDGQLVDFIPRIARTPELQRRLLVDNPMRLCWSR